jgi:hypothetical protein
VLDFKGELAQDFWIVFLKGQITLRAKEKDLLGTCSLYGLQIFAGQVLENLPPSAPEGIMSAAAFLIAQYRIYPQAI